MKKLILLIILGFVFVSCNRNPDKENLSVQSNQQTINYDSTRDGLFIHITESYNDPHRVLMPMKMAVMMSKDKDVLVYMDIHAVELIAKDSKDLSFRDFESFQTYLKQLIKNNVKVYACPSCMKIAGLNPEDLAEGVQVAEKDKFFSFTKGRIISLDY